ncbi:MAG: CHASE2 domain-containing protein, partial [Deltaproteobacteria bacterium]|nr:CHASE2 domain-containing protein [Deltaproteobacteria bacterium]
MIKKIFSEKHEKTLLILLGATFLTIVLMNLEFNLLESNLYDLRVIYSTHFKPSPEIVLITLDDSSTKKLNEFSPLPLNYHTELLETLEKYKPKAIGYIIDMNRVSELNAKIYQSKWSTRFIESVQRLKHKGIPFIFGTPFDVTGEVVPPFPLSKLSHSIAVIHKDGNIFSEDKVTRRALTYLNEKPVFHLSLAQSIKTAGKERPVYNHIRPKGNFFVPELESEQFFFRYHSSTDYYQKHIPYKTVSFASILENKNIDPSILNGKILLIGTISKDDSSDFTFTPYSKKTFTHPKLLVHANILDSLLQNDGIVLVPKWVNWIITFACTAFVIGWVIYSTPLYGVFSTLGLVIGFVLSLLFLFNTKGLWIRASQPLVGIFVSYYLIVPYRLILEYKKRWNFQKKSELLVQVEELKTN